MKNYFKYLCITLIISIIMIFIFSVLLSKTEISEKIIRPVTTCITFVSIFIGAFGVSKSKKEKGIINGLIIGLLYIAILYIISILINKEIIMFGLNAIIMTIISIIGGVIGGILGVNF